MSSTARKKSEGSSGCCLSPSKSAEQVDFITNNNNNNNLNNIDFSKRGDVFPPKTKVNIQFENIRYTVREWSIKNPIPVKKEILHGVSGEFKSSELTAIMGPSGAGKSTLLNIIAGFTVKGISGNVKINGIDRSKHNFKKLSCYIQQDDFLRDELTVVEAMSFAADLKLGYSVTRQKKATKINEILDMLGLSTCAETSTGRLSGGQKKRLSVALELLNNPPVIFLDEPTTGLDSSSCSQCIQLLKFLSHQGRTVICTIHQPSALIFEMFDKLYTLAGGNCLYSGTITNLLPHLDTFNLTCPPYHNPADFLIDVTLGEYNADLPALTAAANVQCTKTDTDQKCDEDVKLLKSVDKYSPPSVFQQFLLLYQRKLVYYRRRPMSMIYSCIAHVAIALIFGYLYRGVGSQANAVFGNYVYMYGSTLLLSYTGQMTVTLSFPIEMQVFEKEHFNRWYRLIPYYLSVVLLEIPIQIFYCVLYLPISYVLTEQPLEWHYFYVMFLSVVITSFAFQSFGYCCGVSFPTKIAVFVGPCVVCLLSVFGFAIRFRDMPDSFKIMYYISFFRASFENTVYTMYSPERGLLKCGEDEFYCHFKTPKLFLEEMGFPVPNVTFNISYIFLCGVIFHVITCLLIWRRVNSR